MKKILVSKKKKNLFGHIPKCLKELFFLSLFLSLSPEYFGLQEKISQKFGLNFSEKSYD